MVNAILVTTELKSFPNPVTRNSFKLMINLEKDSYILSLTTKSGQKVYTRVIQHNGGSSLYTIQLPTLAAGIYQLNLRGNNISITRQLIKN